MKKKNFTSNKHIIKKIATEMFGAAKGRLNL
jgi:hypothetical protein